MGERKVIRTTCKGCHGGCGVLVTVEDGVIVHVEGDPQGMTEGTMCAKGLSQLQHVNNPYRIKYPIQRTGKKGEGKWRRIGWDEALDTIASKCKEFVGRDKTASIRELYYQLKHTIADTKENTFEDQSESDPLIVDLETTLHVLREELHLKADVILVCRSRGQGSKVGVSNDCRCGSRFDHVAEPLPDFERRVKRLT